MTFRLFAYEDGKPTMVETCDGFCHHTRPFEEVSDGWMLEQLNSIDFPAIGTGQDMLYLVNEVNRLRRELFKVNQILNKL